MILSKNSVMEKIKEISDGSVIAISGFNNTNTPLFLIDKLLESYIEYKHPKNIFIETDAFPGVPGTGLDKISKWIYENKNKEFISGMLMPYLFRSEYLQKIAMENYFDVYSFSIGIASWFFREIGSGRPGVLTKIGIGTFHDPRYDNSFMNDLAKERKRCFAEIMKIDGEEYLLYRAPKPNVAFIRGTYADEIGNMSMDNEGIYGDVLGISLAARSKPGGIVFAQVEEIVKNGSIKPKNVHVPGPLIDYVVQAPREYSPQGWTFHYDPRVSGQIVPSIKSKTVSMILDSRTVIKRRVALELANLVKELKRSIIANFGTGMPSEITEILEYENIMDKIYTTVESGPWGGIALKGNDFGLSIGPFAIIPEPDQFSIYEGGIADVTTLGFLEVDKKGNVNPAYSENVLPGPGGFTDISNGVQVVYFSGFFNGGDKIINVKDKKLVIEKDGNIVKFVKNVKKIYFNGEIAVKEKKRIKYITERAVFSLSKKGLILEEIAPGIDIDKDIMEKMEFKPIVSEKLKTMDERIFVDKKMNLYEIIK